MIPIVYTSHHISKSIKHEKRDYIIMNHPCTYSTQFAVESIIASILLVASCKSKKMSILGKRICKITALVEMGSSASFLLFSGAEAIIIVRSVAGWGKSDTNLA